MLILTDFSRRIKCEQQRWGFHPQEILWLVQVSRMVKDCFDVSMVFKFNFWNSSVMFVWGHDWSYSSETYHPGILSNFRWRSNHHGAPLFRRGTTHHPTPTASLGSCLCLHSTTWQVDLQDPNGVYLVYTLHRQIHRFGENIGDDDGKHLGFWPELGSDTVYTVPIEIWVVGFWPDTKPRTILNLDIHCICVFLINIPVFIV